MSATSNATSVPECAAPTTSTGPGLSCSGLRYSHECSWRIDGSRSKANSGMRGVRPNVPVATTRSRRQCGHLLKRITFRPPLAAGRRGRVSGRGVRISGVRGQVVGDLVLGRIGPPRRREGHPWQAVGPGRRVEAQRVPLGAPVVADMGIGVEDQAGASSLLQLVQVASQLWPAPMIAVSMCSLVMGTGGKEMPSDRDEPLA